MRKRRDITGQKFGRLLVINRAENDKNNKSMWNTICDCGKNKIASGNFLLIGTTKSCGCLRVEMGRNKNRSHGMSGERFYEIWEGLKDRCSQNRKGYEKLGFSNRWKRFENFKTDMFESYNEHVALHGEKNTSIDRINNKGGYSPTNCRWATAKLQAKNRGTSHRLTYNGVTKYLVDWAEDFGIKRQLLYKRVILSGWSVERALTSPLLQ